MTSMKIRSKITLIATNVRIHHPPNGLFPKGKIFEEDHSLKDDFSERKLFKCVGIVGDWEPLEKGWRFPSLLNPMFGWSNLVKAVGVNGRYLEYQYLEDAIFSNSSLEDLVLKLQLVGYENAFQIPTRFLKELERKASKKIGPSYTDHFILQFKDLKNKCKRLL